MIKRIFSLTLAPLAALILLVPVRAASTGNFAVSGVSGKPEDTVEVKIDLSVNPGLVAMRLFVTYDSSKLKLISATDGKLFGSASAVFGNDIGATPYIMMWEDSLAAVNHTANGTLAMLTFKIQESATAGSAAVTVSYDQASTFDKDLRNVPLQITNGSVTVAGSSVESKASTTNTPPITATTTSTSRATTSVTTKSTTAQVTPTQAGTGQTTTTPGTKTGSQNNSASSTSSTAAGTTAVGSQGVAALTERVGNAGNSANNSVGTASAFNSAIPVDATVATDIGETATANTDLETATDETAASASTLETDTDTQINSGEKNTLTAALMIVLVIVAGAVTFVLIKKRKQNTKENVL